MSMIAPPSPAKRLLDRARLAHAEAVSRSAWNREMALAQLAEDLRDEALCAVGRVIQDPALEIPREAVTLDGLDAVFLAGHGTVVAQVDVTGLAFVVRVNQIEPGLYSCDATLTLPCGGCAGRHTSLPLGDLVDLGAFADKVAEGKCLTLEAPATLVSDDPDGAP